MDNKLYLLDANVLIDANRDYYPMDRIPEFWEWLIYMGSIGQVKIPIEIFEEIEEGNDNLSKWSKDIKNKSELLLDEEAEVDFVSEVTDKGYADNLTDVEIERIGRDPFLISYALSDIDNRCVVTTESSKPKRQRANRHIPDVCHILEINCYNTFEFVKKLDFRTNWKQLIIDL